MPTERLSMRRRRDLLRLKYAQGLSDRAVARSLGLGKGTVGNYLARARGQVCPGRFRQIWTMTAWSCCYLPARRWPRGWIGLCRIGR